MSAPSRPLARSAHPPRTLALPTRLAGGDLAADLLLLGPVLLAAFGLRLVNLGAYSGLFDEGIRAEQLFLMSRGFRPFKQIFAAQGPLLLDALYPLYGLFSALVSSPLVAVRLAPVIVGLACGLRYGATGRAAWLAVGGLLLTVSLLMKPITLAAAPAFALAALLRGRRGLRDLVLVGAAMAVLTVAVVWLLGFAEIQNQIFEYRAAASREFGWSLRKNLAALQAGLAYEPAALLPLAALGGLALLIDNWRRAL